jgi:hypothetical protein
MRRRTVVGGLVAMTGVGLVQLASAGPALAAGKPLTIIDSPEDLQAWADTLIGLALAGGPTWPHPHTDLPTVERTVAQVWKAIEAGMLSSSQPWSIAQSGLPSLPEPSVSDEIRPMNVGSAGHNVLHAILGDFH